MTEKQTILIAGGTGNIGGGAAVALAKRGARAVLLGRRLETLEDKADSIRATPSETRLKHQDADIATLAIDFSDVESVRLAAAEALGRFPSIHGLVLSVAALVQNGPNILPSGHELMFATNVMGPFLFTQLLIERMQQSDGIVLHVIKPTYRAIAWDDLESIRHHKIGTAFERTKTCNRVIAAELARRYAGRVSSVAFNPSFIIDKSAPELAKRWPSGFMGLVWSVLARFFSKPPVVAGEPIAESMLSHRDRSVLNGALFKLGRRNKRADRAMNDEALGERLWEELARLTGISP